MRLLGRNGAPLSTSATPAVRKVCLPLPPAQALAGPPDAERSPRLNGVPYPRRSIFARYSSSVEPPIASRSQSLIRSVRLPGRNRCSDFACFAGLRSP